MLTMATSVVDELTTALDTGAMVREATDPKNARPYHHGNLREALVEAGVELARGGGPGAVQLRAASRTAGTSHNAAYRHFADQQDLLAVVGQRCMGKLGQLMIERMGHVTARGGVRRAQARLDAIGRAYVEFARTEPGWFRTAFSAARPHDAAASSGERAELSAVDATPMISPFHVLSAQLDELVEVGVLPKRRRAGAEYAAWSAVHGVSSLVLDGPLRELPEREIERAVSVVLAVVARGLA
jgi:AcrR family transcriptional regulator